MIHRVTTSGTKSDNEWQRMTTSDNEWQRVVVSAIFKRTNKHPRENSLHLEEDLEENLLN